MNNKHFFILPCKQVSIDNRKSCFYVLKWESYQILFWTQFVWLYLSYLTLSKFWFLFLLHKDSDYYKLYEVYLGCHYGQLILVNVFFNIFRVVLTQNISDIKRFLRTLGWLEGSKTTRYFEQNLWYQLIYMCHKNGIVYSKA